MYVCPCFPLLRLVRCPDARLSVFPDARLSICQCARLSVRQGARLSCVPFALCPFALFPFALFPFALFPFALLPFTLLTFAILPFVPLSSVPLSLCPFSQCPFSLSCAGGFVIFLHITFFSPVKQYIKFTLEYCHLLFAQISCTKKSIFPIQICIFQVFILIAGTMLCILLITSKKHALSPDLALYI